MSPPGEGIVVLGVPRSGTTLLRRLLNAHPRISCPPETNLLSAASRFLEEHRLAGGLSVGVVPGLDFSGYSEQEVLARLRGLVFGFFRDIAQRAGKRRWAEKTAVDVFHLKAIERLCADECRFLFLVRHPLDVVCSLRELSDKNEYYLPELHGYVQRYPAPMVAFAHAWRDANESVLEFIDRHPAQSMLIRYEDLTESPQAVLRSVFEFLNEPADVEPLLELALARNESVGLGDWKTYDTQRVERDRVGRAVELSRWTVGQIMPIVAATMARLGYEPMVLPPGETAEELRRREELGRMVAGLKFSSPRGGEPR